MIRADSTVRPFYYWGQVFERCGPDVKVLARYRNFRDCFAFDGRPYQGEEHLPMLNKPGIVTGQYGKGRVILSGPHPEIGEEGLYVHWIRYLAGGRGKTVQGQDPEHYKDPGPGGRLKQGTTFDHFGAMQKAVKNLMDRLQPYESEIRPYYRERWEKGVTIGLPVLVIFLDTCHRLGIITQVLASIDQGLGGKDPVRKRLLEIEACYERETMAALKQIEALLPELGKTIDRLKEMDRMTMDRRRILHMDGSFYPDSYYQLISDLKTSNIPLVKTHYLLKDLRAHGLLDEVP
jgi:hypothetical protein